MNEAYVVQALRTAGGRKNGKLKDWHPVDLGGAIVDGLLSSTGIDPQAVDDLIFGCVGQSGEQSTNLGRNVVLASSLPETVPGTTVDRQCGSSQQTIQFASQAVMSGTMDIVIAGGVESMTRVPMGLAQRLPAEQGFGRYMSPRLQRRYPGVVFSQFEGADSIARQYGFSREAMDRFGFHSQRKAAAATLEGRFKNEILPIEIASIENERQFHSIDEGIRFDVTQEAIATVKLLTEHSRLSAATSSQICDGAAAVLIVNQHGLKRLGLEPLARIHHLSVLGGDPVVMLDTPIAATQRALAKAGMRIDDIDLYEVNEAFASIPMAWLHALSADESRLNVNGGAIALGHPLGASGARLMTTLIHALRSRGGRYGLQTMCEGGGLANVTIVERL